jgi:hypothetical protein
VGPNPTEPALILVLFCGFFATIKESEKEKVESVQEQPPPTTAPSSPTKESDQSDPWELYVYAIKAPATKAKYCQRLRAFLEFLGYEEGSLQDKARAFAAKARNLNKFIFIKSWSD